MTQIYRLHYAPDNASLVIRLALEELGLPYETHLVDRRARAQRSPDYLAMNPNGTIPVLETPDGVLFETAAILLWLADRHGALAPPQDSPLRAPFLKWLFWCSNTLQIDLRQYFYPEKSIGPDHAHQTQLRQVFQQRLQKDLDIIEQGLRNTPGLTGGDQATALDIYLACLLRWCKLYADSPQMPWLDLTRYPTLHRLCAKAETRGSTRAAQTAEGLGPQPFTCPRLAHPPEGSAT
jgi:glutathione S-transferase